MIDDFEKDSAGLPVHEALPEWWEMLLPFALYGLAYVGLDYALVQGARGHVVLAVLMVASLVLNWSLGDVNRRSLRAVCSRYARRLALLQQTRLCNDDLVRKQDVLLKERGKLLVTQEKLISEQQKQIETLQSMVAVLKTVPEVLQMLAEVTDGSGGER
jgi:hypothetical protein